MPWLGSSSGERPLKILLTPALKSTRTPSRSQNILYPSDDDVVVNVVSSAEFFDALKNPERDCCVFAFLECCACVAEVVRFDMIDEWRRRDGVHLKAIVL